MRTAVGAMIGSRRAHGGGGCSCLSRVCGVGAAGASGARRATTTCAARRATVWADISREDYAARRHNVWDEPQISAESEDFYGRARERVHREFLRRVAGPPGRLLDVGCGLGYFLARAQAAGWQVRGSDTSQAWVRLANERLGGPVASVGELPEALAADERFELITAWDVIEHVHDPLGFLEGLASHLAPGGAIFLRTPNLAYVLPLYALRRRLGHDVRLGPTNHVVYFTAPTLRRALERAGCAPCAGRSSRRRRSRRSRADRRARRRSPRSRTPTPTIADRCAAISRGRVVARVRPRRRRREGGRVGLPAMDRTRTLAVAGGCLVLSAAGFACGSDRSGADTPPPTTATAPTAPAAAPTNIVGNDDIRRDEARVRPERAVMTWAQAVQFGDLAAVRSAYTRRVRDAVGAARLDAAAKQVGSILGRPEIVTPLIDGDRARVRAALVSFDAKGARSQQPTTFVLRLEEGQWRLDDARLLLDAAAAMRRATP